MKIFGREPVVWLGAISAVLAVLVTIPAVGLTADAASWVMVIVSGVFAAVEAVMTRPFVVTALTGAVRTVITGLVFFGLPLDVRHVTLSTGQVTAALAALGGEHLGMLAAVWLVVGILGIGLLNILVSFSLALFVAIRARNLRGPERRQFYRALVGRFLKSPWSFLLPTGVTSVP